MRLQAAAVLSALIGAASPAAAQTNQPLRLPASPRSVFVAPTPAPVAPPTGAAPAPAPPDGLSPLLTQPGLIFRTPERASPSYPSALAPAPVDQQKMQSYRNDLINQRFQLDRQGVSPDSPRYREIQRQLNQPGLR
jgi:hypothetical protein